MNNPDCEEQLLLSRLRIGDAKAFEAIYERYRIPLGKRILFLIKSEELAEEVLQDLFIKVWENRERIDSDKSFKSYLYRIGENQVLDLFRRAKKEKEVLNQLTEGQSEHYAHVEELLFDKEEDQLLENMLDQLPKRRREVFLACKVQGKSYKEAAEEFGISTTTVNDHIQKATQYLRSKLKTSPLLQAKLILYVWFLLS